MLTKCNNVLIIFTLHSLQFVSQRRKQGLSAAVSLEEGICVCIQPVCVCVCVSEWRLDLCSCSVFINDAQGNLYLSQNQHSACCLHIVLLAKNSFWVVLLILMWYISLQLQYLITSLSSVMCPLDPHRLQFPEVTKRLKGRLSGLFLTSVPQREWKLKLLMRTLRRT